MERAEYIKRLEELLTQIEKFEAAYSELKDAEKCLKRLQSKPLSALNDFDATNKDDYIALKVGPKPVEPKGAIKLAVPIYLSKKKAYEKEYTEYLVRYRSAEQEYYTEYKETRERLESEESAERTSAICQAEKRIVIAREALKLSEGELAGNDILSSKLKNSAVVTALLDYFQDQRVDSVKDAVNLYFEEEHRRRLEAYAEEQVRLTSEAAKQAQLAALSAREAADNAAEAVCRVDDAMRNAKEAYDRADEAYMEAQRAYFAATSNSV